MPITREAIEARLATAQNDISELSKQALAVRGVIIDLEYWLAELAKPDPPDSDKPEKD